MCHVMAGKTTVSLIKGMIEVVAATKGVMPPPRDTLYPQDALVPNYKSRKPSIHQKQLATSLKKKKRLPMKSGSHTEEEKDRRREYK